jgi:DNA-binding transcriptional LysR family regulator
MEPVERLRDRLDELALFVELVTSGSVTAAARRLAVPKSTITRGVARLEEALGVALVRRIASGHVPTEAGASLAARSEPHLTGLRDAALRLSATATPRASDLEGVVRLSVPPDLGVQLAQILTSFSASYPRIRLEVDLTLRVVDVSEGKCDLALRVASRGRLPDSSLVARRVGTIRFALFGSSASTPPRKVDALAGLPHVLLGDRASALRVRLKCGQRSHVYLAQGAIATNDVIFALEATASGAGIGLLPAFVARDAVRGGRLIPVLAEWSPPEGRVLLVHRAQRPLPLAVQALRDHLAREAPPLLASLHPGRHG